MKFHEIELCGEKHPIAYPVAAIERLANEVGKDPFAALGEVQSSGNFGLMLSFVRVGLESGAKRAGIDFSLTNTDLGELLDMADFTQVGDILKQYLPRVEPGEAVATATEKG